MPIALACDHADVDFAHLICGYIKNFGHDVICFIPEKGTRVDYPEYAKLAAGLVVEGKCSGAILICGTGVGMSIAANKIKSIRAVCCSEPYSARLSREHNDANVLCIGARVVGLELAKDIVRAWLSAEFEGDRHARRLAMIKEIETEIEGGTKGWR